MFGAGVPGVGAGDVVPGRTLAVIDTYVKCVLEYGSEWPVICSVFEGDSEPPLFARLLHLDFCKF